MDTSTNRSAGSPRPRRPPPTHLGYGVWRSPHDGETRRAALHADALAWQSVLPAHACFTHLTGAVLRGWWHPPVSPGLPLFVAQAWCQQQPQRPQLYVTRHRAPPDRDLLEGVPVASAGEILLSCARTLGLLDLVILIDGAAHAGERLDEIHASATRRRRGAPRLREALGLADTRSESLWETVLRMLHVACQVPVTSQWEVRDPAGGFVARGDLRLDGTRVLHEYDGAHHRDAGQQHADLRRDRALGNSGWRRRGYTAPDLMTGYLDILRDCDLSLGRAHIPARIRPWEELLAESLLTPMGVERLDRLLRMPRARRSPTL